MKNLLLAITVCFGLITNSFAQCPDAGITAPGFHPEASLLPPIEQGVSYDETVQVNIPATLDTNIGGNPVTANITNIVVNSITGQPSGITYACTPSNCTINGGTAGCVNFTGTTSDSAGTYPLTIMVTASVTVFGFPQTIGPVDMNTLGFSYFLTVTNTPVSVKQLNSGFEFEVFPNPSNGIFTIAHANLENPASIQIFDMSGKMIFEENINETGAIRREMDLTALPKGIYSLQMVSETGKGVQRLTIY